MPIHSRKGHPLTGSPLNYRALEGISYDRRMTFFRCKIIIYITKLLTKANINVILLIWLEIGGRILIT